VGSALVDVCAGLGEKESDCFWAVVDDCEVERREVVEGSQSGVCALDQQEGDQFAVA
jgi:hypothetical protein